MSRRTLPSQAGAAAHRRERSQGWFALDCLAGDGDGQAEQLREQLRALGRQMLEDDRRRVPAVLSAFRRRPVASSDKWLLSEDELLALVNAFVAQQRAGPGRPAATAAAGVSRGAAAPAAAPAVTPTAGQDDGPSAKAPTPTHARSGAAESKHASPAADASGPTEAKPAGWASTATAPPRATAARDEPFGLDRAPSQAAIEEDVEDMDWLDAQSDVQQVVQLIQLLEGLGDILTVDRRWVVMRPQQVCVFACVRRALSPPPCETRH
jgi:hypothetical protein